MAKSKRTVYFLMVKHPSRGWIRVGNAHSSKERVRGWRPFIIGAWRGLPVKISQCTIEWIDGKVSDRSKKILDKKYNLDA